MFLLDLKFIDVVGHIWIFVAFILSDSKPHVFYTGAQHTSPFWLILSNLHNIFNIVH